jgi:hypothetical protein
MIIDLPFINQTISIITHKENISEVEELRRKVDKLERFLRV